MKIKSILYAFMALWLTSCTSIPVSGPWKTKKIATGFGPEDIVLDTLSSKVKPRILISCDTRRSTDSVTNGIYWLDLATDSVFLFNRLAEPVDLVFHPHGFDFVKMDSTLHLFVISHDDIKNVHTVIKYRVLEKDLIFEAEFHHKLFISPNDIFALTDGSFFITNDAGKRHSLAEQLFKLKRSSVVYYKDFLNAYYIDKSLSYANGIYFEKPFLYVSTVLQNTIFKFTIEDGKSIERTELSEIKGGDNITKSQNKYLVAAHLNSIAFLRHRKIANIPSPSVIYQFDPFTGEKEVLFSDDGKTISAASTAIRYGKYLYISQVFDNFILKVDLE
ncbi:MAG: hypothetical protein JW729_06395 [Bacteroidales bacterium]|nr:hypothetical protein [Bacteroidales bacterium]